MHLPSRILLLVLFGLFGLSLINCAGSPPWVAVFLDPRQAQSCRETFLQTQFPSARKVSCDHATIVFDPPSLKPYSPFFCQKVNLSLLAYARDDNDQAILTSFGNSDILSTNQYPHITVSVSGKRDYSAVYSSALWERLEASGNLKIRYGSDKKPQEVSLSTGTSEWSGILPAFISHTVPLPGNRTYAATKATVNLLGNEFKFEGTVCVNELWDSSTGQCQC